MAKKSGWKAQAKRKEGFQAISSAMDLDLFPNLGEIMNGYHGDDGKLVEGGSILMFVGNDGKLTAIVAPKEMDTQFWCSVTDSALVFESIEKAIQDGKGTWKPKKKK
jgi:hypothetical protein